MMFRAYSKDTDYVASDTTKSAAYYTAFKDAVTADKTAGPDASASSAMGPANPSSEGTLR